MWGWGRLQEVKACLPYLKKQISLVRPRIILLLGATATKHMLPDRAIVSMEKEVGKFFTVPEYPETEFLILYHPAFLLRDPRKKKDMWEHVRTLKRHVERVRS